MYLIRTYSRKGFLNSVDGQNTLNKETENWSTRPIHTVTADSDNCFHKCRPSVCTFRNTKHTNINNRYRQNRGLVERIIDDTCLVVSYYAAKDNVYWEIEQSKEIYFCFLYTQFQSDNNFWHIYLSIDQPKWNIEMRRLFRKLHQLFSLLVQFSMYLTQWNNQLLNHTCKNVLVRDMCAINDPFGQTHTPASSDHYFHLEIVLCFAQFWKVGMDVQTPDVKIVITTGRDFGSPEWINNFLFIFLWYQVSTRNRYFKTINLKTSLKL